MPLQRDSEPLPTIVIWLERGIIGCVFLIALFAPNSIAVTQIGWALGTFLWIIRLFVYPRPQLFRTPIDYALLGFFVLTGISAFFSYAPFTSIGKLRAASLFTIVYLVAENVRTLRLVSCWLCLNPVLVWRTCSSPQSAWCSGKV
jgi:hypothetical protein